MNYMIPNGFTFRTVDLFGDYTRFEVDLRVAEIAGADDPVFVINFVDLI